VVFELFEALPLPEDPLAPDEPFEPLDPLAPLEPFEFWPGAGSGFGCGSGWLPGFRKETSVLTSPTIACKTETTASITLATVPIELCAGCVATLEDDWVVAAARAGVTEVADAAGVADCAVVVVAEFCAVTAVLAAPLL
jgi:hypothetical protein